MEFDLECDAMREEFEAEITVSPSYIHFSCVDRKSSKLLPQSLTLTFSVRTTKCVLMYFVPACHI